MCCAEPRSSLSTAAGVSRSCAKLIEVSWSGCYFREAVSVHSARWLLVLAAEVTASALSCRRRVVCALLWWVRPVSVRVCPGRGLCVGLCWSSAAQALVCLLAPGFL